MERIMMKILFCTCWLTVASHECTYSLEPVLTVNCQHKKLSEIPADIPTNTSVLLLSDNRITSLNVLKLPYLVKLDLSQNRITTFNPTAFKQCQNLQYLDLSKNGLEDSNFPASTLLSYTPLLKNLTLSSNNLYDMPNVSTAGGLQHLLLNSNKLRKAKIPDCFKNLKRLESLDLSDNPLERTLINTTFSALGNVRLRTLVIQKNRDLRVYEIGAFAPLMHLQKLDLSYNIVPVDNLKDVFCLTHMPTLSSLFLDNHYLGIFTKIANLTACLKNFPLDHLSLRGNSLRSLTAQDLKPLQKLSGLDLENNLLSLMDSTAFMVLKHLKFLNIAHNALTKLPSHLPAWLLSLSIYKNFITEITAESFAKLTNLQKLDLSRNTINKIEPDSFKHLSSLQTLSLSYNNIESLPVDIFANLTSLRWLHLDGNRLTTLPANSFSSLQQLHTLSLSNNRLGEVPLNVFSLSSLKVLKLKDNRISLSFKRYKDKSSEIFEALHSLEVLTLGKNAIETLPLYLFANNGNLSSVALDKNKFKNLSFHAFPKGHTLKFLNFSSNQIATVRKEDIPSNSESIDLIGNPFMCDCRLIDFKLWLSKTTIDVIGKDRLLCSGPPAVYGEPVIDFNDSACKAKRRSIVTLRLVLVGAISLVVLLAIIVLFVAALQKYRIQKLKQIVREQASGGSEYQRLLEHTSYFCYSNDAEHWIRAFIMPIASNVVFTHDVEPQGKVDWNLRGAAIARCRVVVVILTARLARDKLAEIEFQGILARCSHDKHNSTNSRLHVILLRISPSAEVPSIFHPPRNFNCLRSSENLSGAEMLVWDDRNPDIQQRCLDRLRRAGVDLSDLPSSANIQGN